METSSFKNLKIKNTPICHKTEEDFRIGFHMQTTHQRMYGYHCLKGTATTLLFLYNVLATVDCRCVEPSSDILHQNVDGVKKKLQIFTIITISKNPTQLYQNRVKQRHLEEFVPKGNPTRFPQRHPAHVGCLFYTDAIWPNNDPTANNERERSVPSVSAGAARGKDARLTDILPPFYFHPGPTPPQHNNGSPREKPTKPLFF